MGTRSDRRRSPFLHTLFSFLQPKQRVPRVLRPGALQGRGPADGVGFKAIPLWYRGFRKALIDGETPWGVSVWWDGWLVGWEPLPRGFSWLSFQRCKHHDYSKLAGSCIHERGASHPPRPGATSPSDRGALRTRLGCEPNPPRLADPAVLPRLASAQRRVHPGARDRAPGEGPLIG
jgi:hypothetical protein